MGTDVGPEQGGVWPELRGPKDSPKPSAHSLCAVLVWGWVGGAGRQSWDWALEQLPPLLRLVRVPLPSCRRGSGGVRGKQHWMSLDDPGPLSLSGLSSVSRGHSPAVKGWGRDLLGPSGWISPSQASRPGPGSPLLGLHVHHQGDVALDEGEGEEADVTTVIAGRQGVLRSVGRGRW